jgi:SAM-dependent methyltransferase
MSKHDYLTSDEVNSHEIGSFVLRHLNRMVEEKGVEKKCFRVLDFGCGRGRSVARLLSSGFDAYGVDVDLDVVRMAEDYYREHGFDAAKRLAACADFPTDFPDAYFDFIFSEQVFEHVSDIELVASEIGRITKPDGGGVHVFPASKAFVEEHLGMPFVHWLPKNQLRYSAILFWLVAGKDPRWAELEGCSTRAKAKVYFAYSCEKTFYRKASKIEKTFQRQSMEIRFHATRDLTTAGPYRALLKLFRFVSASLYRRMYTTTVQVYMVVRKTVEG